MKVKNNTEHFNLVSDLGKINFPSKEELQKHFDETGEDYIFVLDTSVCLDIVSLIGWGKNSKAEKSKIFNLIEFCQKNNVEYFAIWGLLESSYNRENLEIKYDMFDDYYNKLNFAFNTPIKKFRKLEFDFYRDFPFVNDIQIDKNIVKSIIDSRVNPYYAGLLKICEIAQRGMGQNRAQKNVEEFYHWMENDLGYMIGHEYRLALQIFGGNSEYWKMLRLGSKKEIILKESMKSAWDIFHAKMSTNNELLSELVSRNVRPIFVTKDSRLFDLLSPKLGSYIRTSNTKVSLIPIDDYPKIYSQDFITKMNEKTAKLGRERLFRTDDIDDDLVKDLIRDLEDKIK
ncbi:hypothetical protein [Chryseobacterium gleum]|uniref:hypothetical protein n=1 Tax=Chryseobacterium gleum TaxID=250 RepID=UPI0028993285|nr:hypothetical protein [Chryseobacterium gleum]